VIRAYLLLDCRNSGENFLHGGHVKAFGRNLQREREGRKKMELRMRIPRAIEQRTQLSQFYSVGSAEPSPTMSRIGRADSKLESADWVGEHELSARPC
jgi:hypothetical protein